MSKDMSHGEIREYNGKNYKYVEQNIFESDDDWNETCCKGCAFDGNCTSDSNPHNDLGKCFEDFRKDGRNGIFIEVWKELRKK